MYENDPIYAQLLRDKLKAQKPESPALEIIYFSTKEEIKAYMKELK